MKPTDDALTGPYSSDSCCRSSLLASSPDGSQVRLIPLYCHKWGCPRCGKKKAALWKSFALSGKPERLITLTAVADPNMTPYDHAKRMKKALSKLVERMRRKYGTFEYLAVWELTKARTPHIHLLQRGTWIPKQELSDCWCGLTGAYIVDIKKINDQDQVARYVTKYLYKSIAETSGALHGLRMVQKSKNWILPEYKDMFNLATNNAGEQTEWTYIFASPFKVRALLVDSYGYSLKSDPAEECHLFLGEPRQDILYALEYNLRPQPG